MTSVVLLSVVRTMKANSSIIFVQCPFVTVEVSVMQTSCCILSSICKAVNEQKKTECNSNLKQP